MAAAEGGSPEAGAPDFPRKLAFAICEAMWTVEPEMVVSELLKSGYDQVLIDGRVDMVKVAEKVISLLELEDENELLVAR